MTIKEAREKAGITRQSLSDWLEIPYRTLENWEKGTRECPRYVEKLIVEKIEREMLEKEQLKERLRIAYVVEELNGEIRAKDWRSIKEGCLIGVDENAEWLKKFYSLEEAREELKKYKPSCQYVSGAVPFYSLTEYVIESYKEDEDGEFIEGSEYDMIYEYYVTEDREFVIK